MFENSCITNFGFRRKKEDSSRNHEVGVSSTRGAQILFHFTKSRRVLRLALKDPMRVSNPEKVTYLISKVYFEIKLLNDYQS